MRSPSVAVPHSIPPWSPPGPTSVFQRNLPVFASRSTYTPLFSPKPTTLCLPTVKTFVPEPPRSHFSPSLSAAHHVTEAGCEPQARSHGSCPCTRYDQRICPVLASIATSDLKYAPGGMHDSLKPFGAAALQAVTLGGVL